MKDNEIDFNAVKNLLDNKNISSFIVSIIFKNELNKSYTEIKGVSDDMVYKRIVSGKKTKLFYWISEG